MVGTTLLSIYFMRKSRIKSEVITKLKSLLSSQIDKIDPGGKSHIDISYRDYELITEIERAQIYRDRQRSILDSYNKTYPGDYIVQKSRRARQQIAQLQIDSRLHVEERLDELMINPEPTDVIKDTGTSYWRLHVPAASTAIDFLVDNESQVVKIMSLKPITDNKSSRGEVGD